MCQLMEDLINDVLRDDRIETAKKLIANGKNSLSEISEAINLPLSTVEELAASIRENNPDLTTPESDTSRL